MFVAAGGCAKQQNAPRGGASFTETPIIEYQRIIESVRNGVSCDTEEGEVRFVALLAESADVRQLIVHTFTGLSPDQQSLILSTISVNADVHGRVFEEFRSLIANEVVKGDPRGRAVPCLRYYDVDDRRGLLARHLRSLDAGACEIWCPLNIYLQTYGTGGIEDVIGDWLTDDGLPEFRVKVAVEVIQKCDNEWRAIASAVLDQMLSGPQNLAEIDAEAAARLFNLFVWADCSGDEVLLAHARRIAIEGRAEAKDAAARYCKRFDHPSGG